MELNKVRILGVQKNSWNGKCITRHRVLSSVENVNREGGTTLKMLKRPTSVAICMGISSRVYRKEGHPTATGGCQSKPWLCARRPAQELDHLGFLDAHPPRREVFSCYSGADTLIISEDHELRGAEGTRRGPHLHMHVRITELPSRTHMEFSYLQQEVIRGFRFKFGAELRSLSLRP